MANTSTILVPTLDLEIKENTSSIINDDSRIQGRLSFSSETDVASREEPSLTCKVPTLDHSVNGTTPTEITENPSRLDVNTQPKAENTADVKDGSYEHFNSKRCSMSSTDDKENATMPTDNAPAAQTTLQVSLLIPSNHDNREESDAEVLRRAQEEDLVNVVLPGSVTQEGCCRFVSEILKCILYQRQQLPMTYDQLVYSQKKQQASAQDKETVGTRPVKFTDLDWRKCKQTLQELEEVLTQLEVLFSLSLVPRVLLLLGGSLVLPKEMYEINMEALVLAGGDQCLRVSSCLRQLFRTLFVADILSDERPVRLMPTTVLALAHRDCGVGWFRPKLQFKVPTRVKKQIIALSSDPSTCMEPRAEVSDWEDYVWFQAAMNIKGFSNA
ncbi:MAD2L1-binding protein [Genypterus blacodes]|uniref:MAD2L1-binding protein n=1 Tax=Genypterus blacodes TaxID=154954 RepID=UPI003F76828E